MEEGGTGLRKRNGAAEAIDMAKLKVFSEEEIAKHCEMEDLWAVHNRYVYSIPQPFIEAHPGGFESIRDFGGDDMTVGFEVSSNMGHSPEARQQMLTYLIGRVAGEFPNQVVPSHLRFMPLCPLIFHFTQPPSKSPTGDDDPGARFGGEDDPMGYVFVFILAVIVGFGVLNAMGYA